MELVVTDHHTMTDSLPCAVTVVHPRVPGSTYPFQELCGAGVAFKLAWAVCQRMGTDGKAPPRLRDYLMQAVGLAAMGTVADVVPLRGENRVLVAYGLQAMLERPSVGLEMLLKVCELQEKKQLTAEDIGFAIGPRLNAAGRLGQARLAVELLTTEDRSRAAQLTAYIDQLNKDRQTVERRMFKQAKETRRGERGVALTAGPRITQHRLACRRDGYCCEPHRGALHASDDHAGRQ